VQKYAKVIAAHAELLANQVFIVLVQEDPLKQFTVFGGKVVQSALHQRPAFLA
jgi:predicted Zn-dependent protease